MRDDSAVLTEQVQEWIAEIEYICQSREIREFIERLEKDGAYPQTVIQLEED